MFGYQVRVPGESRLLNALQWDKRVDPVAWQPGSTIFERAAAARIGAFRVASTVLERTGLSAAAMRGAAYYAADTMGALVAAAAAALRRQDQALAMVYYGGLDATGHACGSGSDAWRYQLGHVDKLAEQLAGALPPGTTLYITADHGMVDVAPHDRIDAETEPAARAGEGGGVVPPQAGTGADPERALGAGVALRGGEPGARHVYAEPGAATD